MLIEKKIKYEVMDKLLKMKDSDEEYEKWMRELEQKGVDSFKSLSVMCFYITLLESNRINDDNFIKTTSYFQSYTPQDFDATCSICQFYALYIYNFVVSARLAKKSGKELSNRLFAHMVAEFDQNIAS